MQSEIKPIIEVKGVSKFFGEKTALDNINLSIKKGGFVTSWALRDAVRRPCCA